MREAASMRHFVTRCRHINPSNSSQTHRRLYHRLQVHKPLFRKPLGRVSPSASTQPRDSIIVLIVSIKMHGHTDAFIAAPHLTDLGVLLYWSSRLPCNSRVPAPDYSHMTPYPRHEWPICHIVDHVLAARNASGARWSVLQLEGIPILQGSNIATSA